LVIWPISLVFHMVDKVNTFYSFSPKMLKLTNPRIHLAMSDFGPYRFVSFNDNAA